MYESFYGLRERPFAMLPDPHFLYWGQGHTLAFSTLEYGMLNAASFTVITGEIGSGKTTLIRHLLSMFSDHVTVGLISNVMTGQGTLLEWILHALNQPFDRPQHVALFGQFQDFLIAEYAKGRHTIIIIDEAQNLDMATLEEFRMLSNINADGVQLLQVILVGQPELRTMLQRPELAQFAQRVSADYHLGPLNVEESVHYIYNRIAKAGGAHGLFSRHAAEALAIASKGIPRVLNGLCDAALVYGFSRRARKITSSIADEVIRDRGKFYELQLHLLNPKGKTAKKVVPPEPKTLSLKERSNVR